MKRNIGSMVATAVAIAFAVSVAWADMENIPATIQGGTLSGVGTYTGYAKYTNSQGFWIMPSNGVTGCTFSDNSSFGSNYVSVVVVTPFAKLPICSNSSSITVPLTNTTKYTFVAYIKSKCPPPTNSQTLNLQVNWLH